MIAGYGVWLRKTEAMTQLEDVTTILFDFHATLACSRDTDAWIQAAHEHAGQTVALDGGQFDGNYERARDGLNHVWVLARKRDSSGSWDLSAAAHRRAFTTVMTKDAGCATWLADALYEVMVDQWLLYDDVAGVLTLLRQAGKSLGVVSNIGIDIRPRLDTLGILSLLDCVTLSFEAGLTKPDPGIFAKALEDLGSHPAGALMVGDTWDQDGGAAAVGMAVLILPIKEQPSKGLKTVLDICHI